MNEEKKKKLTTANGKYARIADTCSELRTIHQKKKNNKFTSNGKISSVFMRTEITVNKTESNVRLTTEVVHQFFAECS